MLQRADLGLGGQNLRFKVKGLSLTYSLGFGLAGRGFQRISDFLGEVEITDHQEPAPHKPSGTPRALQPKLSKS